MKRMHVHVSVENVPNAIGFYSALFAAQPAVVKDDYAKWMLDDPRVNFAISTRGREPGLDHLGIQVENADELHEVYAACGRRVARSLRRGRPRAATQNPKNHGSTIRREFRGRRFTPPAKPRITAPASRTARRSLMPKPAARHSRLR